MKFIDIENWERKQHYDYFKQLDYPHFNMCSNVDITEFYRFVKEKNHPFFISMLYLIMKTANSVKEFRYRIREDKVVEHETVNASFTVMAANEVFSFCTSDFIENFEEFRINTSNEIEKTKENVNIGNEENRDDYIYTTSIPWISFTSVTHPVQMNPVDSTPMIAWGKYFEENGRIKLPVSVQAHHALIDGVHVGKYFITLQKILDNPEKYL